MNFALYLAYKNLINSKKLFFLVVGILIFSFINISFFNSLNNGIRDLTNQKLIDYSFADLKILPKDKNIYINNTKEIISKVETLPEVKILSPRLKVFGTITDGKNSFVPVIFAIDPSKELEISKISESIPEGNFIGTNSLDKVIIGDEIVGNLDGSKGTTGLKTLDLGVGDKFILNYDIGVSKEYRVNGILDTYFWIPDLYLLLNIKEARKIYNFSDDISSEILIKLNNGIEDKEAIKRKIINLGINARVIDSLKELSLAETILKSQKVTTILANIIGIFSTFVIIFIIIYINVNHKKKEIAIFKSIGISEKTIIKSYIYLSLFYAIFGIIFGFIFLELIILYLKSNPLKLPMGFFYPKLRLEEVLISSLIILLSSIVAGFVASYSIVKSNIVKVLRGII